MKYYAGIGSRSCPLNICDAMTQLATTLNNIGYTLRSGNAISADQAFAKGVFDEKSQIWLPWKEFNFDFQLLRRKHTYKVIQVNDSVAFESIDKFHPSPKRLGLQGVKLMARNYRQIVGLGEPNSQFVLCWTTEGREVGGAAQAIRIARHFSIPVYNLYDMTDIQILKEIEKLNLLQ